MSAAKRLRQPIAGERALIAPAVFNPLSATLAGQAGFEVLYLGGGAMGYLNSTGCTKPSAWIGCCRSSATRWTNRR